MKNKEKKTYQFVKKIVSHMKDNLIKIFYKKPRINNK